MSIETPSYTVIQKNGNKEVRVYEPYMIAEVSLSRMEYEEAMGAGFQLLADYIFGNNERQEKIAMTAPVMSVQQPQKGYKISFMMPSKYRKEDLPFPKNTDVTLTQIKGYKAVALRFSGNVTPEIVSAKTKELREWVKELSFEARGDVVVARYNPPFTPWFLRRNEVILPVEA